MRRLLLVGLIIVLAMASVGPSVSARATYTLRFNHVLGPGHPYHAGFQRWAERVSQRTNGDLQITVFHSAQLGVEEDILEQMRQGVPVGQNTDSARLGNYIPEIAVMNAPYFVSSIEDVIKLSQLPTIRRWREQLARQYGFQILSLSWVQGERHFMTNKPIRKPEDLRGLRIRTAPAPIWQEGVRSLGATPTAMAFGEIYPALQQGAVDGVELVYHNIVDGSLFEVLKYVNETSHFLLINFIVTSASWFNRLPAEYQRILMEECDRAGLETSFFIRQDTDRVKKFVQEKGMTIVRDVDMDAFKAASESAYRRLNLLQIRDQLHKDLREAR